MKYSTILIKTEDNILNIIDKQRFHKTIIEQS